MDLRNSNLTIDHASLSRGEKGRAGEGPGEERGDGGSGGGDGGGGRSGSVRC